MTFDFYILTFSYHDFPSQPRNKQYGLIRIIRARLFMTFSLFQGLAPLAIKLLLLRSKEKINAKYKLQKSKCKLEKGQKSKLKRQKSKVMVC